MLHMKKNLEAEKNERFLLRFAFFCQYLIVS